MKKFGALLVLILAAWWFYPEQGITPPRTIAVAQEATEPEEIPQPAAEPKPTPKAEEVLPPRPPETRALSEAECWAQINGQIYRRDFLEQAKHNLPVQEWFIDPSSRYPKDQETKIEGKFLRALALSGYLSGKTFRRNDEAALKLFAEVIAEDPTNSAPFIFMAMIAAREKRPELAEALMNRAANQTEKFDVYLTGVTKAMMAQVRSPEDLVQAIEAYSRFPVPDFAAMRDYIASQKEKGTELVVRQIAANGSRPSNKIENAHWTQIEYATAVSLLTKINPKHKLPSLTKLKERKDRNDPLRMYMEFEAISPECSLEMLGPAVQALHRYL